MVPHANCANCTIYLQLEVEYIKHKPIKKHTKTMVFLGVRIPYTDGKGAKSLQEIIRTLTKVQSL